MLVGITHLRICVVIIRKTILPHIYEGVERKGLIHSYMSVRLCPGLDSSCTLLSSKVFMWIRSHYHKHNLKDPSIILACSESHLEAFLIITKYYFCYHLKIVNSTSCGNIKDTKRTKHNDSHGAVVPTTAHHYVPHFTDNEIVRMYYVLYNFSIFL